MRESWQGDKHYLTPRMAISSPHGMAILEMTQCAFLENQQEVVGGVETQLFLTTPWLLCLAAGSN
jgi:hypothetical protein